MCVSVCVGVCVCVCVCVYDWHVYVVKEGEREGNVRAVKMVAAGCRTLSVLLILFWLLSCTHKTTCVHVRFGASFSACICLHVYIYVHVYVYYVRIQSVLYPWIHTRLFNS